MIRWILFRILDRFETRLGASMDYLRHVVRVSPGAFMKFAKINGFAQYRRRLPVDAWSVAHIAASLSEDCGSCVQIAVNEARRAGLDAGVIRAAAEARADDLPESLGEVFRYCTSVAGREDDPELREKLRARYGEEGLIELAYAIAASRIYPTVKRALGYATSCSKVKIEV